MDWQGRIVVDPEVLVGKPVVKGTRLAVEFVIDLLAQGWTEADILRNYPGLAREDILACLAYAGEVRPSRLSELAGRAPGDVEMPLQEVAEEVHRYRREKRHWSITEQQKS